MQKVFTVQLFIRGESYYMSQTNSTLKRRELPQEVTRALIPTRVDIQVLLMIVLSIPPLTRRQHLRDHLTLLPPLLSDQSRHLLGHLFLLLIVIEDPTPVLTSRVRALPILCRGIMHLVEELQQRAVRHLLRIKRHLQCLGVARPSSAHGAVRRVRRVAADVAHAGVEDGVAREVVAVEMFDAPKATGGDGGFLGVGWHGAGGFGVEVQGRGGGEGAHEALDEVRHCVG